VPRIKKKKINTETMPSDLLGALGASSVQSYPVRSPATIVLSCSGKSMTIATLANLVWSALTPLRSLTYRQFCGLYGPHVVGTDLYVGIAGTTKPRRLYPRDLRWYLTLISDQDLRAILNLPLVPHRSSPEGRTPSNRSTCILL
jgi:hypothetical protein